MNKTNFALGISVVALVIAGLLYFGGVMPSFGSATACTDGYTCFTNVEVQGNQVTDGTTQMGSSGTAISKVLTGTCTLLANFSIAATSTRDVDCAVTGVVEGDKVFLSLSTTTGNGIASQYSIVGTHASTTSGFVTAKLLNLTGTAATPAATANFGSSTQYYIVR